MFIIIKKPGKYKSWTVGTPRYCLCLCWLYLTGCGLKVNGLIWYQRHCWLLRVLFRLCTPHATLQNPVHKCIYTCLFIFVVSWNVGEFVSSKACRCDLWMKGCYDVFAYYGDESAKNICAGFCLCAYRL